MKQQTAMVVHLHGEQVTSTGANLATAGDNIMTLQQNLLPRAVSWLHFRWYKKLSFLGRRVMYAVTDLWT